MATYVFFNISAYGHVNPTLPIVAELSRRGHKIYYFIGESFTGAVQKAGASRSHCQELYEVKIHRHRGIKRLRFYRF